MGAGIADTYFHGTHGDGEYKWTASVNSQVVAEGSYSYKRVTDLSNINRSELTLTLGKVTSGWIASQEIVLQVGLRNKFGQKGDERKVEMVIGGPDKNYSAVKTMSGDRMAIFVFPIEFGIITGIGEYMDGLSER